MVEVTSDAPLRCFRYREGAAPESQRLTHYLLRVQDDGRLMSWCRRDFHTGDVEECDEGTGAPCPACWLRIIAAIDQAQAPERQGLLNASGKTLDRALATLLVQAHWDIDEAMREIPAGRYTATSEIALANNLTWLARVLRVHAHASGDGKNPQ